MITKEELKAYIRLTQEVESLEELIERLQSKKDNIGATTLTAAAAGSGSPDKMASNIARLDDLLVLYHEKLERWLIQQKKIEEAIDTLPEKEKTIMHYRYLMGLEWEEITYRMRYSWQHTHRIHAAALKRLKDETQCD